MSWWLVGAVIVGLGTIAFLAVVPFLQRWRNATAIDVVWTLTVWLGGSVGAVVLAAGPRGWLVAALVASWGGRLAWHLVRDRLGGPEDGRYQLLREELGERFDAWLWPFALLQAASVPVFILPVLLAADNDRPWQWGVDGSGILLALVAIGGVALADRQLAAFRADPGNRGAVCRRGLWAWSRHPNYFFQWLQGPAYALLAWGHPMWWLVPLASLVELVFLLYVTGVPYNERQSLRSRGDAYRRYQREVSVFLPLPPRSSTASHPASGEVNP